MKLLFLCGDQSVCTRLREYLPERSDGLIDMEALQDEWWKKAKDGVAGAVNEDATLEHSGENGLSEL